jgi:hypothetical protein
VSCHLKRKTIRNKIKRVSSFSKPNWPDLIDFGKGSASSTAAVLVGNAVAGPVGGIASGIVASGLQVMLKRVVSDQRRRKLSTLEEIRTGKVLLQFRTKLEQNLREGRSLREDGFLSRSVNERSVAAEIFEGILLAAQREYEERKIKFEGNLLANIVCDSTIRRESTNFLVRLARRYSNT